MDEKRSEVKLTYSAAALTALQVLGVDVQVLLAQYMADNPELVDLMALIKQGSVGGWQSIAAMWAGIGLYSWLRTKIKLKG
jgi:hypothetical protein